MIYVKHYKYSIWLEVLIYRLAYSHDRKLEKVEKLALELLVSFYFNIFVIKSNFFIGNIAIFFYF